MKRLLFTPMLLILALFSNILEAQNCGFAQTGIRYNYSTLNPGNGNCIINVDLYFDLFTNSGSKFITAHIWPKADYPIPALTYKHPPTALELAGATTVVIDHFQDHTYAYIDDIYLPDLNVHPQYIGMNLIIGPSTFGVDYKRFTITNLNLEVAGGCGIPQVFTMDVWATESASMNSIHCSSAGFDFYANNPKITGLLFCDIPRQYNVQITSIDPVPMTVNYDVYVDNGDYNFNKVEDTLKIKTVSGISISSSQGYNSGVLNYMPYGSLYPYANMNLWVEVSSSGLPNTVIYGIENNCAALPITLKSFTAKKIGENVQLNWITASEIGNKGFYIERKTGSQEWQTIGFVNSHAEGGNSHTDVTYNYNDPITVKAIIQYRLKQTDLDGKFDYSPVRVIRNEGNEDLIIFPNPSSGNISLVFNNIESNYQISLFSTEGKLIKKWQNCNTLLTINDLKTGMYFVKIENILNKEIVTRKIVIQ